MNLYKKLLLAQAPIAIALAIVGIFSVIVVSYLGSHSQTILKDNYRSVLAAQRMKEAIERMDSGALFIVAGERQKGLEQAKKNRPIFEAELKVQEGNITEAGEKEFTAGLRDAWTDYQAKFAKLEKSASVDEAKQLYFSELESVFYKVKSAADEILAINQDTMVRKSDDVRRAAERINAITVTVALAALALGLLVSTFLTRRMLQPVSALSEATRKIGEGNFLALGLIVLCFAHLRFQRSLSLRAESRKKSGDGRTALAQRFQGENDRDSSHDSSRQPKLIERSEQGVPA